MDKAHFHLRVDTSTHSCKIRSREIPVVVQEQCKKLYCIQPKSPRGVILRQCSITGPFSYEKKSVTGPICFIIAACYEFIANKFMVFDLQQLSILSSITFMQDRALPHTAVCVWLLLSQYFYVWQGYRKHSFLFHNHSVTKPQPMCLLAIGLPEKHNAIVVTSEIIWNWKMRFSDIFATFWLLCFKLCRECDIVIYSDCKKWWPAHSTCTANDFYLQIVLWC